MSEYFFHLCFKYMKYNICSCFNIPFIYTVSEAIFKVKILYVENHLSKIEKCSTSQSVMSCGTENTAVYDMRVEKYEDGSEYFGGLMRFQSEAFLDTWPILVLMLRSRTNPTVVMPQVTSATQNAVSQPWCLAMVLNGSPDRKPPTEESKHREKFTPRLEDISYNEAWRVTLHLKGSSHQDTNNGNYSLTAKLQEDLLRLLLQDNSVRIHLK